MIGKYNGKYFNVNIKPTFVKIWTYKELTDFRERYIPTGNTIYEKYVDLDELEEIFEVWFSVKYQNNWYIAAYDKITDKINIVKNLDNNSPVYQAYLLEKGLISDSLKPEECQTFKITKRYMEFDEKESVELNFEEFKENYKNMVEELSKPR